MRGGPTIRRTSSPESCSENHDLEPLHDLNRSQSGHKIDPDCEGSMLLRSTSRTKTKLPTPPPRKSWTSTGISRAATDGPTRTGSVIAIVSGKRQLVTMPAQERRSSYYGGRFGDLISGKPPALMPLTSDSWIKLTGRRPCLRPVTR